MGDEMSKRKKFLFITWVGPNVSVINRAKMSTDKSIIKDIISVSFTFLILKVQQRGIYVKVKSIYVINFT